MSSTLHRSYVVVAYGSRTKKRNYRAGREATCPTWAVAEQALPLICVKTTRARFWKIQNSITSSKPVGWFRNFVKIWYYIVLNYIPKIIEIGSVQKIIGLKKVSSFSSFFFFFFFFFHLPRTNNWFCAQYTRPKQEYKNVIGGWWRNLIWNGLREHEQLFLVVTNKIHEILQIFEVLKNFSKTFYAKLQ